MDEKTTEELIEDALNKNATVEVRRPYRGDELGYEYLVIGRQDKFMCRGTGSTLNAALSEMLGKLD